MDVRRTVVAALVGCAAFGAAARARAEEPACDGKITREKVAACAVRASLSVRAQKEAVEAAKGRQVAAEPALPSAPMLQVSSLHRSAQGMSSVVNLYAQLSQEIEIAGQRGARLKAAEAGVAAEEKRGAVTQREAALAAWRAYFEALGAAEQARIARRAEAVWATVAKVAAAGAESGVAAEVDAELAEAHALRTTQTRLAAERAEKSARVTLAGLLGRDPAKGAPEVEGDLSPLAGADEAAAKAAPTPKADPPEAGALDAERRAAEAKAEELRRARVPNVTLHVFVQRDGFDELAVGAGLSLPIPLPQPVTRTNAGEIAESEALARKAGAEAEAARRKASVDLAAAVAEYAARKAEVGALSAEKLARTEKSLANLAAEVEAGRLAARTAVPVQQALLEVLLAHAEAKRALCLASIEVARAAGLPVEGAR